MQIKQLYVQPHQSEYPQLQTDKEADVYGYLENLQSICYPSGIKLQTLQVKNIPQYYYTNKSSSQSPVKKPQQGQIDTDALEILKQHSVAHFTITTSLGIKRYISYLLCHEPQQINSNVQTGPSQASFGQHQTYYLEYNILPFVYVIVQDSPAFEFAKKTLNGLYETSLLPYYQMVCLIDQNQFKLQHSVGAFIQPLKIEFILSYLFKIVNRPMEDASVKNLSEFRDSGSVLTFEDHLQVINYDNFYRPNISYKVLLKKISIQNILQLLNCLLLQKKLIIISRDTDTNALVIEALLDLIYPLNSAVFMNISNLKQELIDYLDSPVPYIIGINESIWNKMFMKKWNEVSDDTVCFVIDTELFTTKVDLPNPPEPMNTIFSQTLQDILNRHSNMNDKELKLYIRQAAFNYLLLIINDFRPYKVNFKDLEGDKQELFGMQKDNNIIGLQQIFRFESYLQSQQIENYEFYVQFTETQLFNDFLERALRTNTDQSLNYFICCLDILKQSQSFTELLIYQQTLLNQIQQEVNQKQVNYIFSDILESYERALNQFDRSIYIKSLPIPQNTENGLFQFNPNNIQVNLYYEIQKQGCIRNLIKRPSTTKRTKPSKKSDNNLGKHHQNFITNQIESRNQSNSIKDNQQIISQVYFQKGPQKVSTPKGLPSEMKSMGNFLSEDDSKSTNSKDHKNSQEENKSENSSFKSFFRFTFEKIQNKLKTNKAELSQPASNNGTPQKQIQFLFDIKKINVQTLSGVSSQQKDQKRVNEGPLINSTYYMKGNQQQKSIFSTAFGPKSGLSFGRPKCYSETASSKIQGALQTQIPSNVHYYVDAQNLEARPSAISISNKSYHDSPSSTTYMHESFATAAKGRNEVNQANNSIISSNIKPEAMFKTQGQRDTPLSQGKSQGNSGQKMQSQQQLAYPILNSGIVILKDINRNTKKFVQKININLDPEDERNRRFNQRIQSSMQTSQNQITQSLSNSSLSVVNQMQSSRTLNSSRSGGGAGGIMNSINKTQLSSGLDSPTDHSSSLGLKSSDKKVKNPSFKQSTLGPVKQNSSGRQKAISYNQTAQNQDSNLRKPQYTNIQVASQQNFKQYQTKPKPSLKIKRDSDLTAKQQANQNISSLVSMKKNQSEKNTPLTYGRQEGRSSITTNNHSSQQINSEQMVQGQNQVYQNQQTKKSSTIIQKEKHDSVNVQDETFDGVQQRMRSISYQMSQPEFQSQFKYKMKKDKSLKSLANSNSGNIQSPGYNPKDFSIKLKPSKTGNQTTKISDSALHQNLQQSKTQIPQSFNEYTTFDSHFKKQVNLAESFEPTSALIDSDLLDTPKMKFEGTKISANLGSTISLEQSPSPNINVVGQINPTIVRQDEQFGIYERNMKYNNELQ